MTTDPIADLLTRLRNAYLARHQSLVVPHSRIKAAIVKILVKEGYLQDVVVEGKKPFLDLKINLKYVNREPAMLSLKRISMPGVRHYANKNKLDQLMKGRGMTLLSTSSGIMTVKAAKKAGIGGEIICKIN